MRTPNWTGTKTSVAVASTIDDWLMQHRASAIKAAQLGYREHPWSKIGANFTANGIAWQVGELRHS